MRFFLDLDMLGQMQRDLFRKKTVRHDEILLTTIGGYKLIDPIHAIAKGAEVRVFAIAHMPLSNEADFSVGLRKREVVRLELWCLARHFRFSW
jgi:hypothetical protein